MMISLEELTQALILGITEAVYIDSITLLVTSAPTISNKHIFTFMYLTRTMRSISEFLYQYKFLI